MRRSGSRGPPTTIFQESIKGSQLPSAGKETKETSSRDVSGVYEGVEKKESTCAEGRNFGNVVTPARDEKVRSAILLGGAAY